VKSRDFLKNKGLNVRAKGLEVVRRLEHVKRLKDNLKNVLK
jgi:hypothetical protein